MIANMATSRENQEKQVIIRLYWDAGHGSDKDSQVIIAWLGKEAAFKMNN
jgi:hypothetical protein